MKYQLTELFNIILTLAIIIIIFMVGIYFNEEQVQARNFHLIYVMQEGDTLSEVSTKYGISTNELKRWNNIESSTSLRIGDEIEIPVDIRENEREFSKSLTEREKDLSLELQNSFTVRINPQQEQPDLSQIDGSDLITYHVRQGDTVYDLARRFNTTMGKITSLNDMEDDILRRGEEIVIPVTELGRREVISRSISDQEFDLLARIIHGEARGEPYLGKVAVGAVVINRVLNPRFPETITEVIYDQGQFSPVQDGSYRMQPDSASRQAAREALDGKDPTGGALFFYNPDKATDRAWTQRREKIVTIGNHVFMR